MAVRFGSIAIAVLLALSGCTAANPMYDPSALGEQPGDSGSSQAFDDSTLSDATAVFDPDATDGGRRAADDGGIGSIDSLAARDSAPAKSDTRTTASTCRWGTHGDNGDSCKKVPPETWRCVKSAQWSSWISQVCRGGRWQTFRVRRSGCAACCGSYVKACGR